MDCFIDMTSHHSGHLIRRCLGKSGFVSSWYDTFAERAVGCNEVAARLPSPNLNQLLTIQH